MCLKRFVNLLGPHAQPRRREVYDLKSSSQRDSYDEWLQWRRLWAGDGVGRDVSDDRAAERERGDGWQSGEAQICGRPPCADPMVIFHMAVSYSKRLTRSFSPRGDSRFTPLPLPSQRPVP